MQKSKAKKFILYFTKANRDLKIARNLQCLSYGR